MYCLHSWGLNDLFSNLDTPFQGGRPVLRVSSDGDPLPNVIFTVGVGDLQTVKWEGRNGLLENSLRTPLHYVVGP